MQRTSGRLAAMIAVLALVASACSSSTSSLAPASAGASAPASAAASAGASAEASPSAGPTPITVASTGKPGDVEIVWYCCLGGGDAIEQVEVEKKVADAFNASHTGIHLSFVAVPYAGASDTLAVQLASGAGPDIVGPVGIGGANAFHGQWLDLQPFIDKSGYDMSQFPQSTVDLYRVGGEGQAGIPFAVYPSVLFYRAKLFKEAGLNEPPHDWNGQYTMPDGSKVPWDYDTARKIGQLLTVDANGKDATDPAFDNDKVEQWGFEPQRDDPRQTGAYWKAGTLVAADGKTAQIPDAWNASWHWFYDGIWKDHLSMTGPQFLDTTLNPDNYPFFTGNIAMSQNYLWATWGISASGTDWNVAASPSYQGQSTAAFNADTFRILKSTKHPDEAWTVLRYLLDDAREELLQTYGAMPARPSETEAFFEAFQSATGDDGKPLYPQKIDWNVVKEGVNYADVPNFETYMPNYNKALKLLNTFSTKWQATSGLDIDTEVGDLKSQLQAVFDEAS
jgi:multiple sugar transport system substrate-binding protein